MQKNLKITGIFAAFGFLLSFLFGLFSHGAILSILLKAFVASPEGMPLTPFFFNGSHFESTVISERILCISAFESSS